MSSKNFYMIFQIWLMLGFYFLFLSGCSSLKDSIDSKSFISLEEAKQNGFTLRLMETNSSNRIGTKFYTVSSVELELLEWIGESKGSMESAEEHELVSIENGEFIWKTTNRRLSVCGDRSSKARFTPEFEKGRNKIVRDTYSQNGSNIGSDDKDSGKVLVKMNVPTRLLKQGDVWEGAIIYQLDKNPKEKAVKFKVEKVEMKKEAVTAVINYDYEYDFKGDDGSSIVVKSNVRDWINVNTGETVLREALGEGATLGASLKSKEITKRLPSLPENELPCKEIAKATPTPTPIPTPIPVPTANSNITSNTNISSNSNTFTSNSTQKISKNVYAEVKIMGYSLRSKPNGEELRLNGNPLWLNGSEKLLLISPTNCKTCHQDGWYHVKIQGTGKEGWVHGDAIYFVD